MDGPCSGIFFKRRGGRVAQDRGGISGLAASYAAEGPFYWFLSLSSGWRGPRDPIVPFTTSAGALFSHTPSFRIQRSLASFLNFFINERICLSTYERVRWLAKDKSSFPLFTVTLNTIKSTVATRLPWTWTNGLCSQTKNVLLKGVLSNLYFRFLCTV